MAVGVATLDFGSGASDAEVVVSGQTGLLTTSYVEAWIRPEATADHSVDEHLMAASGLLFVSCYGIVVGTSFIIRGHSANGYLTGQFKINWAWAN